MTTIRLLFPLNEMKRLITYCTCELFLNSVIILYYLSSGGRRTEARENVLLVTHLCSQSALLHLNIWLALVMSDLITFILLSAMCPVPVWTGMLPFGSSSCGPTSRKLPVIPVAVVGVLCVYFYWALRSEHLMIYYDVLITLDIAWESHQACERGSDLTWIGSNLFRTRWNFCVGRRALWINARLLALNEPYYYMNCS